MSKYKKETLEKLGNIETRLSNIEGIQERLQAIDSRLANIEYLLDNIKNINFATLEKYLKEKFRF